MNSVDGRAREMLQMDDVWLDVLRVWLGILKVCAGRMRICGWPDVLRVWLGILKVWLMCVAGYVGGVVTSVGGAACPRIQINNTRSV